MDGKLIQHFICGGHSMTELHEAYYKTEIGWIKITATEKGIRELEFEESETQNIKVTNPHLIECLKQLTEYFEGKRQEFSVQLDWNGTDFQKKVWDSLLRIPYGKTTNYMSIAKSLGDEKAVRAVGTANGRNNIAIIVPCHRVIGSDGSLTGYAYGLWRKEWLLKHENEFSGAEKQMDMF
jgi:methylated-DNA-[protein]-cysteine S-methyltransferase